MSFKIGISNFPHYFLVFYIYIFLIKKINNRNIEIRLKILGMLVAAFVVSLKLQMLAFLFNDKSV